MGDHRGHVGRGAGGVSIAHRLDIAAKARADLADIWQFSAERWGVERAERYVAGLLESLARAAAAPDRGATIELSVGYRMIRAQRHRIVYRFDDRAVTVIRILHDRMDLARHLP